MIYKPILPVDTLLKRLLLYGQIYSLRKRECHRSAAKIAEAGRNQDHQCCGQIAAAILAGGFLMPSNNRSEQECITVSADCGA